MDDGMSNYGNISATCKATGLGYGLATYEQALNSIEKREDGCCFGFLLLSCILEIKIATKCYFSSYYLLYLY